MSTSSGVEILQQQPLPPATPVKSEPALAEKKVEVAQDQTSKGWYIAAIVVGSLALLLLGTFGTVGLLKSYNLIPPLNSSFDWLVIAIDYVGSTPYFLSLWAIAAGGVVVGGGLIAYGSYKIGTAEQQEVKKSITLSANNFAALGIEAAEFNHLNPKTFVIRERDQTAKPDETYYIVARDAQGRLEPTPLLTRAEAAKFGKNLFHNQNNMPADVATTLFLLFSTQPTVEIPQSQRTRYGIILTPKNYLVEALDNEDGRPTSERLIMLKTVNGSFICSQMSDDVWKQIKPILDADGYSER